MELHKLTAYEINNLLSKKEVKLQEVVECIFKRIEEVENKIRSYITLTREVAIAQAQEFDNNQNLKPQTQNSKLLGIPIAIKDNICTCGIKTTCASKILENFIPPYDATVIKLLKDVYSPIIGKTNLDEFAMGSSCENSGFFPTRNPHDIERVPGGSSGGSAASVASECAIWSLGSDTGGSIRQPAAFCGVVGMKPTYGRVSRFGLVAFASSLDQIGPITRDVRDCAYLLNIICGHDKYDSTSVNIAVPDFTKSLVCDVKNLKIGLPKELYGDGIDKNILEYIYRALKILEKEGAKIEETSLPHIEYALATYYIIATSEASSNLARYDGVKYGLRIGEDDVINMYKKTRSFGFGDEVKRRIIMGTYSLSSGYYDAYYLKAQKVRAKIQDDFKNAFLKYDVLITPTTPTVAFKIGEKTQDPLQMYLSDICTIPVNLAGLPAISIPCGKINGLPVGLQIIGKHFDEETLIKVAYTCEQALLSHLNN